MFLAIKTIHIPCKVQVLMWGLQDQNKGEANVSLVSCTKFKGAPKKLSNINDTKAIFQKSKLMHRLGDAQKINILNKDRLERCTHITLSHVPYLNPGPGSNKT